MSKSDLIYLLGAAGMIASAYFVRYRWFNFIFDRSGDREARFRKMKRAIVIGCAAIAAVALAVWLAQKLLGVEQ